MSPARRSTKFVSRRLPENSIRTRRDNRVLLTDEMKVFLEKSPLILVPNLKLNIKGQEHLTGGKKCDHVPTVIKKQDLSIQKTVNLPEKPSPIPCPAYVIKPTATVPVTSNGNSDLNFVKETTKSVECSKYKDPRDDDSKKACFLSALNLVGTPAAGRIAQNLKESELTPSLQQKLRSRKGQVVSFFRKNPVPISSNLGKKIIRSGLGRCSNPAEEITRYEKYCASQKFRNQLTSTDWPLVNVKKSKLKAGQYCHKYSFNTRQRINRNVELTIGLSSKSFNLLNQCRDLSIPLVRMTDEDVAQAMGAIQGLTPPHQGPSSTHDEPKPKPIRWIASEPTAGPSRDIERIATPVVMVYDIKYSPTTSKYFR